MRVAIETLGCSKNTVDSEFMAGYLKNSGYEITDLVEEADFIIINTCSFILDAKIQSVDLVVEMAGIIADFPEKKLIVAGCLAERYVKELKEEIPEISAFIGTANYDMIVEILKKLEKSNKTEDYTGNKNKIFEPTADRLLSGASHYAYLKISEGCNNYCAFCVIPKLKGKYRSRRINSLISETKYLAKNGVKELIIIAQDISRYGMDFDSFREKRKNDPCYGLIYLLKELEKIKEIKWIRLHYLYPDIVGESLIKYIASSKKILPYFDIPLQHISDNILEKMRRHTDKNHIKNLIYTIRKNIPNACIRTTFIVGFPGETEEDFEELCDFVKEFKLDRVGVFQYSDEEDTHSSTLGGKVSEDEKALRQGELMEIQLKVSKERMKNRIGKVEKVIVDYFDGDKYIARTFADSPDIDGISYILAEEGELSEGDIIDVSVIDSDSYDVICELLR